MSVDEVSKLILNASTLVAAVSGLIVSLSNRKTGKENAKRIDSVHDSVNGKVDKLLTITAEAATAKGKLEGKQEERANPS